MGHIIYIIIYNYNVYIQNTSQTLVRIDNYSYHIFSIYLLYII